MDETGKQELLFATHIHAPDPLEDYEFFMTTRFLMGNPEMIMGPEEALIPGEFDIEEAFI